MSSLCTNYKHRRISLHYRHPLFFIVSQWTFYMFLVEGTYTQYEKCAYMKHLASHVVFVKEKRLSSAISARPLLRRIQGILVYTDTILGRNWGCDGEASKMMDQRNYRKNCHFIFLNIMENVLNEYINPLHLLGILVHVTTSRAPPQPPKWLWGETFAFLVLWIAWMGKPVHKTLSDIRKRMSSWKVKILAHIFVVVLIVRFGLVWQETYSYQIIKNQNKTKEQSTPWRSLSNVTQNHICVAWRKSSITRWSRGLKPSIGTVSRCSVLLLGFIQMLPYFFYVRRNFHEPRLVTMLHTLQYHDQYESDLRCVSTISRSDWTRSYVPGQSVSRNDGRTSERNWYCSVHWSRRRIKTTPST